jgi:hypothetical protein
MYTKAFDDIIARPDFAEKSAEVLGDYPQGTGAAALAANAAAITVTPEAKQYVLDWLKADYGVEMK